MDINLYHNIILNLLRKERLDIPTHTVIDQFTHLAQMEIWEGMVLDYGKNQEVQDYLAPFKVQDAAFTSTSSGFVSWPADYGYMLAASTIVFDNKAGKPFRKKMQFIPDDKLSEALENQVRKVSVDWPVANAGADGMDVYPKAQVSGVMSYLSMPVQPKFAYTVSGRTVTYDSANSVQLKWTDAGCKKVMVRTLLFLGLNIQDPNLIQFSQLDKQSS